MNNQKFYDDGLAIVKEAVENDNKGAASYTAVSALATGDRALLCWRGRGPRGTCGRDGAASPRRCSGGVAPLDVVRARDGRARLETT